MACRMAQDYSLPATAMAPELTEDIVIAMCIHFMKVRSLAKKSLGSTFCGAVNKPSRASANSQHSHCPQPQSIPKQPIASSSSRNEIRRLSKLMFMCVGPLGLCCVHPVQSVNNPDNFTFTYDTIFWILRSRSSLSQRPPSMSRSCSTTALAHACPVLGRLDV